MDIEPRILEAAREFFPDYGKQTPIIFDPGRWKGRMLSWAMRNEEFKTRLFRFVDVLPALGSDELVVRVFREYFDGLDPAPLLIRRGMLRIASAQVLQGAVASTIRAAVRTLARQFIAGSGPRDAMKHLSTLHRDGSLLSIDLLGEVVLSEHEAAQYRDRYLKLLDTLSGELPGLNISLKISSFYSQMDPLNWEGSITATTEALMPVIHKAHGLGVSVTFDMEHYHHKDLTLAIFRRVHEEFPAFRSGGIALQAYLKDSRGDLLELIEWAKRNNTRVSVRLVKGAYWDYETVINRQRGWPVPVFSDKAETDRNFEELTRIIFENITHIYPAIASHNVRSVCNAIALARELSLPNDAFEFQVLYGMGEHIRSALQGSPYKVRVYSPVGELIPGMAYLVRRLLENTSNESFLRKSYAEGMPLDKLLTPPVPGEPKPPRVHEGFRNEPATDFSKEANRARMAEALDTVKALFGHEYPIVIDGKTVLSEDEIISVNPARPEEVIGTVSAGTSDDADRAVEAARRAWGQWKRTTPSTRAELLMRAADIIGRDRFAHTAVQIYEVGKTIVEADADVAETMDQLRFAAHEMLRLARPRRLGDYPGELNHYYYEPKGVGVVIAPWNFPMAISAGMIGAALAAGNCVIYKPSSLSPVTGWRLVEALLMAGVPEGALQFLPGPGGDVGGYLTSHPGVDFVAFTGSMEVGLGIVQAAAQTHPGQRNVKRVIAEMGGKNAVIVDETADLDEAVHGVLVSALGFQGQKCSACSRVIVVGENYDVFVDRLVEAMKSVRIGPPEDTATFMGPVIDTNAFEKIQNYIDTGTREGQVALARRPELEGLYIGPTIIEVEPGTTIEQEEIFGPVLAVMHAHTFDEAVAIANDTKYALTGGLFSRSPRNIERAKTELRAGNIYINRNITGALMGRQPFGGAGMSGIGSKAGGPDYLIQFMNPKSASENTIRKGFAPLEEIEG